MRPGRTVESWLFPSGKHLLTLTRKVEPSFCAATFRCSPPIFHRSDSTVHPTGTCDSRRPQLKGLGWDGSVSRCGVSCAWYFFTNGGEHFLCSHWMQTSKVPILLSFNFDCILNTCAQLSSRGSKLCYPSKGNDPRWFVLIILRFVQLISTVEVGNLVHANHLCPCRPLLGLVCRLLGLSSLPRRLLLELEYFRSPKYLPISFFRSLQTLQGLYMFVNRLGPRDQWIPVENCFSSRGTR